MENINNNCIYVYGIVDELFVDLKKFILKQV